MPHPISLSLIEPAAERNRLTSFFRPILAIPHLIWVALWGVAAVITAAIGWFVVVVRGRMPLWAHQFIARYVRYVTHVYGYAALVVDQYPRFFGAAGYPLDAAILAPAEQNRWQAGFRLILALPAMIFAQVLQDVLIVVVVFSWFVILVTGRQFDGLVHIATWIIRVQVQTLAYLGLLTERYPRIDIEQSGGLQAAPA